MLNHCEGARYIRCYERGRARDFSGDAFNSHLTPHTSHLAPHTSHLTPRTSHLTPHTSHHTTRTSHLTLHTSYLTPHTSHLTPHTSHLTPHTSHLTPHTSHLTPHTSLCTAAACTHTQLAGLDAVSFTMHVVDINQPLPFVPNFAFSCQVLTLPSLPPSTHALPHYGFRLSRGFLTRAAVGGRRRRAGCFCAAALRLLSLPPLLGGGEHPYTSSPPFDTDFQFCIGQQRARKHRQPAHLLRFNARAPRLVAAQHSRAEEGVSSAGRGELNRCLKLVLSRRCAVLS